MATFATLGDEPYTKPVPSCPECGGPADTGAGHDCEATPAYIDLTPTWRGIMPGLLDAWSNVTPENERIMREEFQRVAVAADRYNLISKAYRTYREDPAAFYEVLFAILHGRA